MAIILSFWRIIFELGLLSAECRGALVNCLKLDVETDLPSALSFLKITGLSLSPKDVIWPDQKLEQCIFKNAKRGCVTHPQSVFNPRQLNWDGIAQDSNPFGYSQRNHYEIFFHCDTPHS